MASFAERLKAAIGPRGYDPCMRRSIQTAVLFEAHRVLASRLPELRPFQRKIAFWDMSNFLIQSTDLLNHEKEEVMWRTGTSKEPMQPDTSWKRAKMIDKEIKSIIAKMQPLLEGRTHEEACEMFLQTQYETVSERKGKDYNANWAFTHNNCFLAYRMFYRGVSLNPDLPPAEPPKPVLVPQERPAKHEPTTGHAANPTGGVQQATTIIGEHASAAAAMTLPHAVAKEHDLNEAELESIVRPTVPVPSANPEVDRRRALLDEVRVHMDLLKEFEGIISEDELKSRKRELFMAMPSAPPPASLHKSSPSPKKQKLSHSGEAEV